MTRAIVVGLTSLVLLAAAQSRPDFGGLWNMDPARSISAVQNEPILSKSLRIEQGADRVTIVRTTSGQTFTTVYRQAPPGSPLFGGNEFNGIWYWDGARLVTETAGNVSDKTVRTKEVYTLQTGGSEMVVETLAIVEHGYALRGAQNYASGKDVYRKAAK